MTSDGGSDRWDVGRNDAERAFLARLRTRCGASPALEIWTIFDHLVVTLDVADDAGPCVVRTLRVDFDGTSLVAGNDPTHQITDARLDPLDEDILHVDDDLDPAGFADVAAAWFRQEAVRPIERREWDGPDHVWLEWVLADVDRSLVAQYAGRPVRPPDRVIQVTPPGFSGWASGNMSP